MFEDNQDVLDLIDGVLQQLDDQTKVRNGSDALFLTNVNKSYDRPTGPKGRFRKITRIGKTLTTTCFGTWVARCRCRRRCPACD